MDHVSDSDDGTNPWSRDVPPAPAPTSFDFPSERSPSKDRTNESAPPAMPAPSHHASTDEHVEDPPSQRRVLWSVAVAAVIALLVGGIAIASRTDPSDADPGDDRDGDSTAGTAAIDASSTTAPALERTTTAPPPTTRAPAAPRTTPLPTVPPPPPEWVDGQIVLPERYGQLEGSSELVALTHGGKVLRINLADGQTSTLDLDRRRQGSTLHLGATSMLIADNNGNGRGPTLLPDGGDPITVDIEGSGGFDIIGNGPGPDDVTAYIWSSTGPSERLVVIRPDGSIDEVEDSDVNPWSRGGLASTGERWISDAGGVYLEAPDGSARRVSTGQLIATSGAKLLARECDERRECGWFLIDIVSGERVPARSPEGFTAWNQPIQLSALSPDGRTLLVAFWNDQDETMIDLTTGEQASATVATNVGNGDTTAEWASDSSGYFTIVAGLVTFIDRDTGDATPLAIEFNETDAFSDVAIRPAAG